MVVAVFLPPRSYCSTLALGLSAYFYGNVLLAVLGMKKDAPKSTRKVKGKDGRKRASSFSLSREGRESRARREQAVVAVREVEETHPETSFARARRCALLPARVGQGSRSHL